MKKILILIVCSTVFLAVSCKKKEKKEVEKEESISKKVAPFSLKNADNNIGFTAYKATEKIPVKGTFKKVELINNFEGNTIKEAIDKAVFKIPISAIETADSGRNYKIKKFFFGAMENTLALTGTLNLKDDTKGFVELTMNNITEIVPFNYTINGTTFSIETSINLEKWNTKKAIDSLNEACKALHIGEDGVSKTWTEVAISISSTFK